MCSSDLAEMSMLHRPVTLPQGRAICYSGYREGQSPDSRTYPSVAQIREDLHLLARTRAAALGKLVLISETGWPDQGSAFHASVPSREGAMQYFVDTCRWAEEDGIELFYFAAFDEAWKVGAEGDVGAFWGLWDKDGVLKFG